MSYIYDNGKMYATDRDGDLVYRGEYDIEAKAERENAKSCPFMSETTVYHNDRKNYMVPEHGINKMLNYDVHQTVLKTCIKEKCLAYNPDTGGCKRLE